MCLVLPWIHDPFLRVVRVLLFFFNKIIYALNKFIHSHTIMQRLIRYRLLLLVLSIGMQDGVVLILEHFQRVWETFPIFWIGQAFIILIPPLIRTMYDKKKFTCSKWPHDHIVKIYHMLIFLFCYFSIVLVLILFTTI